MAADFHYFFALVCTVWVVAFCLYANHSVSFKGVLKLNINRHNYLRVHMLLPDTRGFADILLSIHP